MSIDLSIIIPTCDRAPLLEETLGSIWSQLRCKYEVIVVDGASIDGTQKVLDDVKPWMGDSLKVIREPQRQGFVRAANKGFRSAVGRNMMWMNDDARPLPLALDRALAQLDSSSATVGMVAIYHRCSSVRNIAFETVHGGETYCLLHVRGTLYANFGMARRSTFERLGYFDDRYYLNAADPDFSLKCWNDGLRVVPAEGALIDHDEHDDDRRFEDSGRGRSDNELLFSKWDLPAKNITHNDFNPAKPCTLRGLRRRANAAA